MRALRFLAYVALLSACAGAIAVSASRTWRVVEGSVGLRVAADGATVRIVAVEPGSPAQRAGLAPGDRILQIGGRAVASGLAARDALARVEPGGVVGVVALRDGIARSVSLRAARVVSWNPTAIVAALVGVLFLLGATAVSLRPRRSGAESVYFAWCLAGALLLGLSWSPRADAVDWGLFWVDRAARLVFPALYLHLVLVVVGRRRTLARWMPVAYAPAVGLFIAEIHMVGLESALRASDPVGAVDLLQSRVEMGWIGLAWLAGIAALAWGLGAIRHPTARARARWVLAGTALGIVPFLAVTVVPEVIWGREPSWSWLALPGLAIVPLTFTGAVLEYRVMDLALFARRALAFASALAISTALFLGLWTISDPILARVLEPAGLAPMIAAAMITAALAPAIRAGSRELAGRLYYRRRYSFRRALLRVARDLNAERDLPRLTDLLERRVAEALDARRVRLLLVGPHGTLRDPRTRAATRDRLPPETARRLGEGRVVTLGDVAEAPRWLPDMHRSEIQVLVPLRVEERLIAVLAVSPPASGGLLDSDDLDLLRTVAAHGAAAVAGALHLADLREQVDLVRRLQARTEALIESSPIGMAVIDRGGRLRQWNPALESLLGKPRGRVLGRPYRDVLPPALHEVVAESLARSAAEGAPAGAARAYRVRIDSAAAGAPRVVNLAATPLSGPREIDGVLLTVDDVTQRLQLEQKLIQQDRLASVGLLAAGVAHEVNTPLTGISSYAQMLLDQTGPDDPRRPLLDKIVQQSQRASAIARGLLHISRPGGGGEELRLGPVDLGDVVEETISLLAPQIRRRAAAVRLEREPRVSPALGDRSRLQQVAMNLLLNALDAIGPGGSIAVRVRQGNAPGEVVLEVADDGAGIPPEIQDRIFDPFFTTKSADDGTGLGLSISYAIVREHRGSLEVDSSPGRGTLMRVVLPAALTDASRPRPSRAGADRRAG